MRKLIGGLSAVAVLLTLPALADAQRRAAGGARHEFGVDVGAHYVKPDGVDGGIVIMTPLNLRVGLVKPGNTMWELRGALSFQTFGGETAYEFQPGVNLVYANTRGGNRSGQYYTGGAALVLVDEGAGASSSGTGFALNAAVGWRRPYGSAAWRYELGIGWTSEIQDIGRVSVLSIGARLGISLWH